MIALVLYSNAYKYMALCIAQKWLNRVGLVKSYATIGISFHISLYSVYSSRAVPRLILFVSLVDNYFKHKSIIFIFQIQCVLQDI